MAIDRWGERVGDFYLQCYDGFQEGEACVLRAFSQATAMTPDRKLMDELTSEIESVVHAFFKGDESKINLWFDTHNPMLGGFPPRLLMSAPETLKKVYSFVMDAEMNNALTDDAARVLAAATQLSGDADRAAQWFRFQVIEAFHGKTAERLVLDGRAEDVLRYIEMLEAGPLG